MRKLHKQPVAEFDPWDDNREPGERVYQSRPALDGAYIYDLRESNGWGKRALGELTPCLVNKDGRPRLAVLADDGDWYWT